MSNGVATASWDASSRQAALKLLIRRMADRDQTAAAALYDQSCQILYSLALRIVKNVQDAEEVIHDVYCRTWRNAGAYDENRGSVMSWLVLMTRSVSIDLLRSKMRASNVIALDSNTDVAESSERSPEAQAGVSETTARIAKALAGLPAEQRQAVELAFFAGLSHSELAEHLNLPLGTVKTRIRVGLLSLRAMLEEFGA